MWMLEPIVISKNYLPSDPTCSFFPIWFWHFSHWEEGSRFPPFEFGRGCDSGKSDTISPPHLSLKIKYNFHLVLLGSFLSEPDHQGRGSPNTPQKGTRTHTGAEIPDENEHQLTILGMSHLGSGSASPYFSSASWHHAVQIIVPAERCPN